VRDGDWSVVVMRPDGSRVAADVGAGVGAPFVALPVGSRWASAGLLLAVARLLTRAALCHRAR
jgi:hypothetical protein